MANALQLRRGTTAQHSTFTGLAGEVTVDTDKSTVVVHDGSTAGGFPLALASSISAAGILASIKTVDGAGSGLDADTLDGKQLATLESEYQAYADTAVSNLVAAAPATLDTLNELAAALGDDPNFATTVTNSIATKLPLSGGTLTGNLTFGDANKAIFGAGNDLEIYHSGTTSYIRDVGDGDIQIFATDDVFIRGQATNNYMARFNENSYVQLFYNNNLRFATSITGVEVTGTVTADALTVDTDTLHVDAVNNRVGIGTSSPFYPLSVRNPSFGTVAEFRTIDGTSNPGLEVKTSASGTTLSQVYSSGASANLILETNSNERMRIDSSGNVGIGTNSPAYKLDVSGELIASSYNETYAAVTSTTNATTVNCEAGNAFSHTLTENTTFTFSNPPASGTAYSFSLEIIQDASASGFTVTWPASVDWPSATAPTLTATASAKDVFVFYTRDGGTSWYGFVAGQALG